MAPPRTPQAIADKISSSVKDALTMPDVVKRLNELSAEPMGLTPAETAAYMKQETERWKNVITTAHVTID